MLRTLIQDEAGFIVSAELVLIATILVIGLIVGLSEIQHAVTAELNDVAEAIGSLNQSYYFTGFGAKKTSGLFKSYTVGSRFDDSTDDCDLNECQLACQVGPTPESPKLVP